MKLRYGKIANWLVQLLVLLVAVGACWLLERKLSHFSFAEIHEKFQQIPAQRLWLAGGLTLLNYFVLMGYDYLAVRSIGHPLPLRKVALGSFVGFAVSYTLGALFGGTAVRYRMYSSWGLSTVQVVRLLLIMGTTFWLGVFALASVLFLWAPFPLPDELRELHLPFDSVKPVGWLSLLVVSSYFFAVFCWRKPFHFKGQDVRLPSVTMSVLQIGVAALDFILAAEVLHLLIPGETPIAFSEFLAIYVLAWVAVVCSHVPGGVGVMEVVILSFFPDQNRGAVAAALVAFRVIYYLLPFLLALPLFVGHEIVIPNSPLVVWWKSLWKLKDEKPA